MVMPQYIKLYLRCDITYKNGNKWYCLLKRLSFNVIKSMWEGLHATFISVYKVKTLNNGKIALFLNSFFFLIVTGE